MADAWTALNERQEQYLRAIFEADQEVEAHQRGAWSRGERARPAREWRWLPYNTVGSPIRWRLEAQSLVDRGIGATFEALAKRGLIQRRYEPGILGDVLYIQITSKGRHLVRAMTGQSAPQRLPKGTLQAWHWRALVLAYAAGEDGVPLDAMGVGYYGGIAWKTWLRLRDYGGRGGRAPLIQEFQNSHNEYRVRLSPLGNAFYQREWERYRVLYPEVDAVPPSDA